MAVAVTCQLLGGCATTVSTSTVQALPKNSCNELVEHANMRVKMRAPCDEDAASEACLHGMAKALASWREDRTNSAECLKQIGDDLNKPVLTSEAKLLEPTTKK